MRQRKSEVWCRLTSKILFCISFGTYLRRPRDFVTLLQRSCATLWRGTVEMSWRCTTMTLLDVSFVRLFWNVMETYWWDFVATYFWEFVTTFIYDIVETYHTDVLVAFQQNLIGCFIWDIPAVLMRHKERRLLDVTTTCFAWWVILFVMYNLVYFLH